MKALAPHLLRSGAIVDAENVNGGLRRGANDVNRNLSRRYTRMPPIIIPLDGVTDALAANLRSIKFDRPDANSPVEVVKVELFIFATAGVTWTLSLAGATWSSISLTTAGTTSEAYAVSDQPIAVPNGGVTFTVAGSAASTIVRGWIVLHCRADRGVQGAAPSHAGYSPSFVDATTSLVGATLDTQLNALAAAVANDAANNKDLRCVCFLARNFSTVQDWNLPSGAGFTGLKYRAYICATAADQFNVDGDVTATTLTGTGTGNLVETADAVTSTSDDPTDESDDFEIQFDTITGTVELGYVFVWWS